jgi:tripartite-type tricarboxylate transporter receptor subunit TctC
MNRRRFLLSLGIASCSLPASGLLPGTGLASDAWPSKPIRIMHGFPPGGPVDIIARLMAQHMSERLGQPIYVEGRPGAGGTVGAALVAKAPPDGYTLFLMPSGHAAAPGLYKSLPFDPINDFTVASMLMRSPFAILAGPAAKASTIQEFIEQAKAKPKGIDYGTGGVGTGMFLAAVLLQSRTGIQLNHVAYKGGTAPITALVSGEVPYIFTSLAGTAPKLIQDGNAKGLAVTSRDRYPGLPDIPSLAETVSPGFDYSAWYALAGPKGLPPAIVQKLNEVAGAVLKDPEVLKILRNQAAIPWHTTAAEAQAFVAEDIRRWTKVIKDEGIVIQN